MRPMRYSMAVLAALFSISCASVERYGRLAAEDLRAVATSPARTDWKRVGLAAAGIGAALLVDDEIARAARANQSSDVTRVSGQIETLGGGHSDKVIAGFLLYGLAARDARAKAVAFDAFMSSLMASKAITPAIKSITGRERPSGGSDDAFPSNHATQAFAVATAVAEHYDRRWIRNLAYGLAAGVAAARVYHDDHWTSDVITGAIIGTAVSRAVVRTNKEQRLRWHVMATEDAVVVGASFR